MFGRAHRQELTARLIEDINNGSDGGLPEPTQRSLVRWLPIGIIGAAAAAAIGLSHGTNTEPAPAGPIAPVSQEAVTAPPGGEAYKPPTMEPGHLAASDLLYQETATHEAGHVAALHDFGIPVWEVSADDLGVGETLYPAHYFHNATRDAHAYAIIDAAGEEAAVEWLQQHGYTTAAALTEAEPHARHDLADLEVDADQAGISPQQAHDQARRLVHDHQPDINRTAQRLIERGYLDEYDLER